MQKIIFAEEEVLCRASNGFIYVEKQGNIFMGACKIPRRSSNVKNHSLKNPVPVSPAKYLQKRQKQSGLKLPAWKKENHWEVVQDIEAKLGNDFVLPPTIADASRFALKQLRDAIKKKLRS